MSLVALTLTAAHASAQTQVLSSDFDGSIPSQVVPGQAALAAVQGYAGLGTPGYQFSGQFLRSPTGNTLSITLTALPAHSALDIHFLFAAIDSLDGTGVFPSGDFLRVDVDGVTIFRESFANADPGQFQSYVPAPGVELARRRDLGFSQGFYYSDSAYDMSLEPRFSNIPHTAPSAIITFTLEGPGVQSLDDESWAMDNLRISVRTPSCPADFNSDGFIDFFDYDDFVACFESGTCPPGLDADFNQDNFVDFFDYDDFVAAFEAGC